MMRWVVLVFGAVLLTAAAPAAEPQELFNGKDLSGWVAEGNSETKDKDGQVQPVWSVHDVRVTPAAPTRTAIVDLRTCRSSRPGDRPTLLREPRPSAVAAHASSVVLMGGPVDSRRNPTQVNRLATSKPLRWFETNLLHEVPPSYPGRGRRVYPGFLQHASFIAMNPARHMSSHLDFFHDVSDGDVAAAADHRRFYDEYNAVLDMPAEYYLDTIKTVFQDFALVNGTWEIGGQPVRPEDIRNTALLTIEGELDDISGAGQTKAAHSLCTSIPASRRFHYDVIGAGHYGIFSGRRWREKVYPKVRDFIAAHQGSDDAAAKKRAPARAKRRAVAA